MLTRTFVHLPGIGHETEKKLWEQGIGTWVDLLNAAGSLFNRRRAAEVSRFATESMRAFERRDYFHFYRTLPRNELWRMAYGHEDTRIAFLDIETTGLSESSKVTTISVLMDGVLHQAYEPKDKRDLVHRVRDEADIVVTYFGEQFDLPFLRRSYKTTLNVAQIDLCPLLRRHGHTGGLKGIERQFRGMPKRKARDIHGALAPVLWTMYKGGNRKALDALLLYNAEDTIVLQPLFERALKYERECHPRIPLRGLKLPSIPRVKGQVDKKILKELEKRMFVDWGFEL